MGSSDSRPSDRIASEVLSSREKSSGSPALVGKVALITGPTSGIGYETARVLASHGCHVVLAARDMEKLAKVKQRLMDDIKKKRGEGFLPVLSDVKIDLGSLESIREAVHQFNSLGLPLHYLIANAGLCTFDPNARTVDGFEAQVGSNHLGHYYFIKKLLPIVRSSATAENLARIVIVSSRAYRRAMTNSDEIEKSFTQPPKAKMAGYSNSKLFNVYNARYLAQTEKSNNILAFSLHPGVVATEIARNGGWMEKFIFGTLGPYILKNPNQGASTTIHCALAATADQSGGYFDNNTMIELDNHAKNDSFQQKLIDISEKFINEWEAKNPSTH